MTAKRRLLKTVDEVKGNVEAVAFKDYKSISARFSREVADLRKEKA